MTEEKAMDLLDNLIGMVEDNHNSDYDTALKMGIKALEQEPIDYKAQYERLSKKAEIVILQLREDRDRLQDAIAKIRAEIVELTKCPYGTECLGANCPSNTDCMICGDHVLDIIDKYKAESEDKE